MSAPKSYTQPDSEFIKQAFDSITPNYDRLNQILSFGMSETWRKQSAEILLKMPGFVPQSILDLGCGTGKFLGCCLQNRAWEYAVGFDFSSAMLKKAHEAIPDNVLWMEGDFSNLPFLESSFDLIISAFTLRSVQSLPDFLEHNRRILKPNGRVAFLELTRPRSLLTRAFFYPYLKFILPLAGWIVSGNRKAYQFLSQSVQNYSAPEKILEAMKQAGFKDRTTKSFAFGAATLMIGVK